MGTKLSNLKPSFLSLSTDERLALILGIRANRRIPKRVDGQEAKPRAQRVAKVKGQTKGSAQKLIKSLTKEQMLALIAELSEE